MADGEAGGALLGIGCLLCVALLGCTGLMVGLSYAVSAQLFAS